MDQVITILVDNRNFKNLSSMILGITNHMGWAAFYIKLSNCQKRFWCASGDLRTMKLITGNLEKSLIGQRISVYASPYTSESMRSLLIG